VCLWYLREYVFAINKQDPDATPDSSLFFWNYIVVIYFSCNFESGFTIKVCNSAGEGGLLFQFIFLEWNIRFILLSSCPDRLYPWTESFLNKTNSNNHNHIFILIFFFLARYEDAKFFYQLDTRKRLVEFHEQLDGILLGNYLDSRRTCLSINGASKPCTFKLTIGSIYLSVNSENFEAFPSSVTPLVSASQIISLFRISTPVGPYTVEGCIFHCFGVITEHLLEMLLIITCPVVITVSPLI